MDCRKLDENYDCRIKLINVFHSTILAIKKTRSGLLLFFFFLFHVSMQAKKKLILQNFKMKNKQRKFLIPSIKHKTEPVIIPSTTSLEFLNSSNDS